MYKKEIFIVTFFIFVAVGILFSSAYTKTTKPSPSEPLSSLEGVYALNNESGLVDYLKVVENKVDDKKIKVQFLLKPRLATKVEMPWLSYQELGYFLRNEKISLTKNNDAIVSKMFILKNN